MQFETPPPLPLMDYGMHMQCKPCRRTSMPTINEVYGNPNQTNRSPENKPRRLSKKSKSDANLTRLTSQERKVDNLPRKAKSRLYKSELCKTFMETGHCKYGGKCQYAHGEGELRFVQKSKNYKTIKCKAFWTTGYCKYGSRCCFVHNDFGVGLSGGYQQMPGSNLPRAESQPAILPKTFTPTIVEQDERVEDESVAPLWSDYTTSGGLDLNSIADSIVEDVEEQSDPIDAFEMELTRAKSRLNDQNSTTVCNEIEQRLGRPLTKEEKCRVGDSFERPEVDNSPFLSRKPLEFQSMTKHQSLPNLLSPSRKSSRLNVFQQLSTEESMVDLFCGQGQAA